MHTNVHIHAHFWMHIYTLTHTLAFTHICMHIYIGTHTHKDQIMKYLGIIRLITVNTILLLKYNLNGVYVV